MAVEPGWPFGGPKPDRLWSLRQDGSQTKITINAHRHSSPNLYRTSTWITGAGIAGTHRP